VNFQTEYGKDGGSDLGNMKMFGGVAPAAGIACAKDAGFSGLSH
jgi:hypothetical protein